MVARGKIYPGTKSALEQVKIKIIQEEDKLGLKAANENLVAKRNARSRAAIEYQTVKGKCALVESMQKKYGDGVTLGEVMQRLQADLEAAHQQQAGVVTPEMQAIAASQKLLREVRNQAGPKMPVFLHDVSGQLEAQPEQSEYIRSRFEDNFTISKIQEDLQYNLAQARQRQAEQMTPEMQAWQQHMERIQSMIDEYNYIDGKTVILRDQRDEMSMSEQEATAALTKTNMEQTAAEKALEHIRLQMRELYQRRDFLDYAVKIQRDSGPGVGRNVRTRFSH